MTLKPQLFYKHSQAYTHQNILFNFYKKVWNQAYEELNIKSSKLADDFYRFDCKLGIFRDLEPIAFHGYQHFNLDLQAHREHQYFTQFGFSLADVLLERGLKKFITMEYLGVCEEFRRINGNHMTSVVGSFSTQFLKNQDCDALLGVSRNNRSVNKLCRLFGGEALFTGIPLNNTSVDVFIFEPKNIQRHPDAEIQDQVDHFLQLTEIAQAEKIAKVA